MKMPNFYNNNFETLMYSIINIFLLERQSSKKLKTSNKKYIWSGVIKNKSNITKHIFNHS